jgi:hypothetical protein
MLEALGAVEGAEGYREWLVSTLELIRKAKELVGHK